MTSENNKLTNDEIKQLANEPFSYPLQEDVLSDDEKMRCLQIAKTFQDNPKKVHRLIREEVGIDRVNLAIMYLQEVTK